MRHDLKGQLVAVIGASSGIGRAAAALAAEQGAEVVMLSRSLEKLTTAAAGIAGRTRLHAVDMRAGADVEAVFSQYERLDHLILTAVADELSRAKPLTQLTEEDLERSFDKMRGYFTIVKAAAPRLAPAGSIVMMCGAGSLRPPGRGFSLLAAEGAAIPGFCRALARELAPVRVNVVMAGMVDTPIHDGSRDELRNWAETSLPTRRFGQPGDVADAILFAMTNRYVTGSTLTVDGGLLIS
jgi:NAD(P)-dependent dehydrogenase (short-subunit alcohol dehydrogenase family)